MKFTKTSPKWIVEDVMLKKVPVDLTGIFFDLKIEYYIIKNTFWQNQQEILAEIPFEPDSCLIPYTTLNMGRKLSSLFGMHLNEKDFMFSNYSPLLGDLKLLNHDFIMTTFKDFVSNFSKYTAIFGDKLFIRPNSGFKIFTGQVITAKNFYDEINSLKQLSAIADNTLIVVASCKSVLQEYRFVICNNEVVDGSQYMEHLEPSEIKGYPDGAYQLAALVAKLPQKPAEILTCDIAFDGKEFSIIELNSFNCAGLYQVNYHQVIKKVSSYIERKYREETDI